MASLRKVESSLLPHAGLIYSTFLCKCLAFGTFLSNQLAFDLESLGHAKPRTLVIFQSFSNLMNAKESSIGSLYTGQFSILLYLNRFTAESVVVTAI